MTEANGGSPENRKQAISIRLSRSDVRHVKQLADRLGARDSDIIRFALKLMLAHLAPLQDPAVRGTSLVPVFVESGPDLMRHFDLDAAKLLAIINDGAEEQNRVDADDVHLIAMSGMQRSYATLQMARLHRTTGAIGVNGASHGKHRGVDAPQTDDEALDRSLRQYLYQKYLFARSPASDDTPPPRVSQEQRA